jgi:hypothetical protein
MRASKWPIQVDQTYRLLRAQQVIILCARTGLNIQESDRARLEC